MRIDSLSPLSHLEIIPLGGLGEFGMNMTVYRWGKDCVIVDGGMNAGVRFVGSAKKARRAEPRTRW